MIINRNALSKIIAPFFNHKKITHGVSYGLSEAGYDVRVAETVRYHSYLGGLIHWTTVTDARDGSVVRRWGNFALASTIERFDIPPYLVGVAHDKSTHAREGVLVGNTVLEPGWKGYLTLEITFNGKGHTIQSGSGISQIIFHETANHVSYTGKYQNQSEGVVRAIYTK